MPLYLLIFIPVLTAATAQILFKKGISEIGSLEFSVSGIVNLIPRILQNPSLFAGMLIFGSSFLFYLFILSKLQLSVAYPIITSGGIILISTISWIFFRETLSILQIAGIAVIIFGIFLLATKG